MNLPQEPKSSTSTLRRSLVPLALATCCLLSLACAATNAPFTNAVKVADRNAVLFFVDGLDTQRLAALDAEGKTPNIHQRFIENGLRFTRATSCFPTVTYSNAVSLMTGCYPGHHGIIANAWFDRATGRYEDYVSAFTYLNVDADYTAKTIYECLAPAVTASVQCAAARGVTWRWQAPLANGLNWAFGDFQAVDRRVGARINDVVRRARRKGVWPVFQTYYFPGVDKCAHTRGVESERYAEAIESADAQIGRVVTTIESVVGPGKTDYWLVADHGQMNCARDHDLDLARLLRKRTGLKVCQATHHGLSDRCDVILLPGRRHAMIHVRGKSGWQSPADDESIEQIVAALETKQSTDAPRDRSIDSAGNRTPHLVPGIRCVYSRLSGNRICVLNAEGRRIVYAQDHSRLTSLPAKANAYGVPCLPLNASMKRTPSALSITTTPGAALAPKGKHVACDTRFSKARLSGNSNAMRRETDPMENANVSLARFAPKVRRTIGTGEAQAAKRSEPNPWIDHDRSQFDRELAALFESSHTGDVIVFAADGWVFESFDCGGHGGASPRERHIPLYVAGPNVPAGAKCDKPVRIIDVMPTIIDMLGMKDRIPEDIDGKSLIPEFANPESQPLQNRDSDGAP